MTQSGDTALTTEERIRARARELGFTHVAFAPVQQLGEERELLEQWLKRAYHAGMQWMRHSVETRTDPTRIVPGARSMICLAMNYYTPAQHSTHVEKAKISRYAWGDDYHELVGERLKQLEASIAEWYPESRSRRYVDTGPVMEKAWAVRSGIGWLGKNGNVITKDMGSWVFLAEIISTLKLEYDNPIPDHCGTCTACIDACPTGAIVENCVIDSNRCISYLTIEHRGDELPGAENMNFENWVFGCDICQDVCPWNSFQRASDESAFAARPYNLAPSLSELVNMDDDEFRRRFKNSTVKRTKAAGLRRNARTVLMQRESHVR